MEKLLASKIILNPIITEKTLGLVQTENQYTFKVHPKTNKIEVEKAVEKLFKVKVLKVRIGNVLGKKVTFGSKRIKGAKQSFKKAVVTLKVGDKISVFDIK